MKARLWLESFSETPVRRAPARRNPLLAETPYPRIRGQKSPEHDPPVECNACRAHRISRTILPAAVDYRRLGGYTHSDRLTHCFHECVPESQCAPVAQRIRANGCGPLGRGFESLRAHQFSPQVSIGGRGVEASYVAVVSGRAPFTFTPLHSPHCVWKSPSLSSRLYVCAPK